MEENEPNGIIRKIDWAPDLVAHHTPLNISQEVILIPTAGAIRVERRFEEYREVRV